MRPIDWRQPQIRTSDLLALYEDMLAKAREKNDDVNKNTEETSALRGRIDLLKELIRLPAVQATLSEIDNPQ